MFLLRSAQKGWHHYGYRNFLNTKKTVRIKITIIRLAVISDIFGGKRKEVNPKYHNYCFPLNIKQ